MANNRRAADRPQGTLREGLEAAGIPDVEAAAALVADWLRDIAADQPSPWRETWQTLARDVRDGQR